MASRPGRAAYKRSGGTWKRSPPRPSTTCRRAPVERPGTGIGPHGLGHPSGVQPGAVSGRSDRIGAGPDVRRLGIDGGGRWILRCDARVRGITAATGELVAFIDSDDLWHPRKLELQVAAFRAAGDVAFVYTGYDVIDSAARVLETVRPDPRFQGDIYEKLWTEQNRILGPTILATRAMLHRIGLFDERLPLAENLDLRIRLARAGPVAYVDQALYRYRRHSEALSVDWRAGLEQTRRLIDRYLADPKTPREIALRRKALSRNCHAQADARFARGEYAEALAWYRRSWVGNRRKGDVLVMSLRCLLGPRGNALLRALRRRRPAGGAIGGSH